MTSYTTNKISTNICSEWYCGSRLVLPKGALVVYIRSSSLYKDEAYCASITLLLSSPSKRPSREAKRAPVPRCFTSHLVPSPEHLSLGLAQCMTPSPRPLHTVLFLVRLLFPSYCDPSGPPRAILARIYSVYQSSASVIREACVGELKIDRYASSSIPASLQIFHLITYQRYYIHAFVDS